MSRAVLTTIFRGVACAALTVGAMGLGTLGCADDEVVAEYPSGTYADYPPDEYIATVDPVYYDGYPAYWYGGYWYYRGAGGRWNHYDHEPAGLYQRRMAPGFRGGGVGVHVYEHGAVRAGGRGMVRGGGRGGGRR